MFLDLNECFLEELNFCFFNVVCINIIGFYNCSCFLGYKGNGWGCEDIDECSFRIYNCSVNVICNNIIGLFNCNCLKGF